MVGRVTLGSWYGVNKSLERHVAEIITASIWSPEEGGKAPAAAFTEAETERVAPPHATAMVSAWQQQLSRGFTSLNYIPCFVSIIRKNKTILEAYWKPPLRESAPMLSTSRSSVIGLLDDAEWRGRTCYTKALLRTNSTQQHMHQ